MFFCPYIYKNKNANFISIKQRPLAIQKFAKVYFRVIFISTNQFFRSSFKGSWFNIIKKIEILVYVTLQFYLPKNNF